MCFCLSKHFLPNPHAVSGAPWELESSWLSTWAEVCGLCCQGQARDTLMATRGLAEGAATTLPCSSPASLSCLCLIVANAWMNHLSLRDFWWRCLTKDKHFCTIPNGSFFFAAGHCYSHAVLLLGFQAHRNGTLWRTCAKFRVAVPSSVLLSQHFFNVSCICFLQTCAPLNLLAPRASSSDKLLTRVVWWSQEYPISQVWWWKGQTILSEALQWCHPASVMAPVLPAQEHLHFSLWVQ